MSRIAIYRLVLRGAQLRLEFGGEPSQRNPLQPGDVLRVEPSPSVTRILPATWEFPVVEMSGGEWRIGGDVDGLVVSGMECPDCRSVMSNSQEQLADMLLTLNLRPLQEDFVYIGDLPTGSQWTLGVNATKRPCRAMVSACGPCSFEPLWLRLSAAYLTPKGAQAYAQSAFALLTDMVNGFAFPPSLPMFDDPADLAGRHAQLTVLLATRGIWPMAIPLDHFQAYSGYGRFSHYSGIEWILTDKTLLQNTLERESLQLALSDPRETLPHAVFILNDYAKFHAGPGEESQLVRDGISLTTRILDLICARSATTTVPNSGTFLLNPTAHQLVEVLTTAETRYVFANFHTVKGQWMISDVPSPRSPAMFPVKQLGDLPHIRLMQLFHCESVPTVDGPAAGHSICGDLLRAGVGRVSGTTLDDHFLAYVCWVLAFLYRNIRWQKLLMHNAAGQSIDPDHLIGEIRSYFDACGLQIQS